MGTEKSMCQSLGQARINYLAAFEFLQPKFLSPAEGRFDGDGAKLSRWGREERKKNWIVIYLFGCHTSLTRKGELKMCAKRGTSDLEFEIRRQSSSRLRIDSPSRLKNVTFGQNLTSCWILFFLTTKRIPLTGTWHRGLKMQINQSGEKRKSLTIASPKTIPRTCSCSLPYACSTLGEAGLVQTHVCYQSQLQTWSSLSTRHRTWETGSRFSLNLVSS